LRVLLSPLVTRATHVFSVAPRGADDCPNCHGLGRVGDDVPCPSCNGADGATRESAIDPSDKRLTPVHSAEVDRLHPADVDRALSSNAGHDWRRTDFQTDVEIQGQSYHVVHSTAAPGELEIDGDTMYSDVWG
jgi:hypothetical protein